MKKEQENEVVERENENRNKSNWEELSDNLVKVTTYIAWEFGNSGNFLYN